MKKDTRQTKPQGGSARGKFSGRLGYVLSVAGSAVGLCLNFYLTSIAAFASA